MDFIANLFGYILNYIYIMVKNYGVAIIIFSILLKVILLPLSIKQQKKMKKTAKIQVKVKELQNKYKNDPNRLNQEIMALYRREKQSPFSGCLSAIIQIVLLLAIFSLVRSPLTYMKKIDSGEIDKYKEEIKQTEGEQTISQTYPEISVLKYVNNHKTPDDPLYINTNFLGLDLSDVPKENLQNFKTFIIPILYVVTSIISMRITTKTTNNNENIKQTGSIKKEPIQLKEVGEQKNLSQVEKEKEPSAEEMTEQMNKSMSWFMPVMAVSIAVVAPLGLALYWLVNNILMIVERLVLNKFVKFEEGENKNE